MQRVAGSKQVWECLAFTGCFDLEFLERVVKDKDPQDESKRAKEDKERQRKLQHAKVEALAAYNEGARLARLRELQREDGASQRALTRHQLQVLQNWDWDELRQTLNEAVGAFGHYRQRHQSGRTMDIGGSTGGGSRRIIDNWVPPDWRQFLAE